MGRKHRSSRSIRGDDIERDIECATRSDVNVLISGGDDRARASLALTLYQWSNRRSGPFVMVDRGGALEATLGGVVFIEEVGDLSLRMQAELMYSLDRCTGQSTGRQAEAFRKTRVIAATEYNLLDRIASKKFRADLFYRLNVIHVMLPTSQTSRLPTDLVTRVM